jgi:hypothetical protein
MRRHPPATSNLRRSVLILGCVLAVVLAAPAGETFAIDWLQERDGILFEGDGSRNSQWFGFGAPLLAVADGTVVRVVDGKPDIAPGAPPILASPEDFAGNHVAVRIRPGCSPSTVTCCRVQCGSGSASTCGPASSSAGSATAATPPRRTCTSGSSIAPMR